MSVHHRRLKQITFTIQPPDLPAVDPEDPPVPQDPIAFQCQISAWNLDPAEPDGERHYTFCPEGEFREDEEPEPMLELTFFSDWRENGISDFLWTHRGEVVNFVLDHHPDIETEHKRWDGKVKLKAPPVGGEARTTESQTITLPVIGEPVYTRSPGNGD